MPQPDQRLSDGSMVYSMDGLKALNAWNRMQARQETLQEVDKRFGPIEQEYRAHQQVQQLIPKVQAEIDEARRWPHFNENEGDIVRALQHDGRLSLEGAYRRVVLPKLASAQAEFDKKVKEVETATRKKVLAELKAAPTSTSAPTSASRPSPSQSKGNRSLEDIITEQVQTLK
jgi:hypothetical protein